MQRIITLFQSPLRVFLLILLCYLVGLVGHANLLKKTVYGDGVFYYSWIRSVVIDHDINFSNEYAHFSVSQPAIGNGLPGNKYSIGPALLWSPTFLFIHNIAHGSGYEWYYQYAVGITSVLFVLTGLILLFRLLSKYFSSFVSISTIVSLAFATNLLFYGSLDVVNSHALSFFAVTLFLSLLFSRPVQWFSLGLSMGLTTIIRPQDVLIGLLLIPTIVQKYTLTNQYVLASYSKFIRPFLQFFIGFCIMLGIQLCIYQLVYGQWMVSPYISGGEGFSFFKPHIFGVLFSKENGLFLYTPLLLFGMCGFFFGWNRLSRYKIPIAGIFILQLFIISTWSTWWQGASYSGRMFVGSLPIFSIPLSFLYTFLVKKWGKMFLLLTMVFPLSLMNGVLVWFFLVTH